MPSNRERTSLIESKRADFLIWKSALNIFNKLQFLPFKREGDLEDEIPSHVEDALTTRDGVDVGIFEAAQVVLVSLVGEVGAGDAQAGHTVT